MSKESCMRCRKVPDNGLPICVDCRIVLKDFPTLASFLNNYHGDMNELRWLIKNSISDRQSYIISMCKVAINIENGIISLEAPDGNRLAKDNINEINKLYKALHILNEHYGG